MNSKLQPLAYRMSPKNLEQYVGQEHILSKGKLLRRMIDADRITSIILFGPPGTGKTSLARVIANSTQSRFSKLNAVTSGVSDIKRVVEEAKQPIFQNIRTILFIDEIHRFSKSQQDALLPYVEDGTITLIGATTENPYIEVNKALVSRASIFELKPLNNKNIELIIDRAINDDAVLRDFNINFSEEAKSYIIQMSNGDARVALNALELAVLGNNINSDGEIEVDLDTVKETIQKRSINYDADGNEHYDNISAFIKSMRGSDPDAAIFYLARALHGGEDIEFLARRIVIAAAEDVGMANPQALSVAVSAYEAVKNIGMPEARIILAEASIMVATSPKSNASYMAINRALEDVNRKFTGTVPLHLRNAISDELREKLNYGVGYKYAHDFPNNIVQQEYLPQEMKGVRYYYPSENGYEKRIKDWLDELTEYRKKD